MDRLTPMQSFRPARSMTRGTRQRHRPRHLSPSPRPGSRRPFADTSPSPVYITTDCDREYDLDHIPASSPDADLIFHMSPVHSHYFGASSPPLSPLLYSFPRPSHTHGYTKQDRTHDFAQNMVHPRHTRPISSARGLEPRPLSASLLDSPAPVLHRHNPKNFTPPGSPARPHASHASSPIPIPHTKSRRPDLGPFTRPPPTLISSLGDIPPSRFSGHTPPSSLRRIEGFGDEDEGADADESATDSRSPVTPSTAYSYAGSGPFRFAKFLDDAPR